MAQSDRPAVEPASSPENVNSTLSLWRKFFGRGNAASGFTHTSDHGEPTRPDEEGRVGLIRRVSRKVVPGLPRAQTFKRQQSEIRYRLEPVQTTPAERRAVSMDRRMHASYSGSHGQSTPRTSAPDFVKNPTPSLSLQTSTLSDSVDEKMLDDVGQLDVEVDDQHEKHAWNDEAADGSDNRSMTSSQYDAMIHDELERMWILNLSMHFRDKSKREKFFVTYLGPPTPDLPSSWRRVTVSLDYREMADDSLEWELSHTRYQREKIAKIYEAIRESLPDIRFYPTVTNLKLQTTDGRLHVHVVEDVNEIIHYPRVHVISHVRCHRVRESQIEFHSHMSGFVYKVKANNRLLVKKEIPGPDSVDEFLYEINALDQLRHSQNVIQLYGVVVDDHDEFVKGLLISYAERGTLIDVIHENEQNLSWPLRQKWARQIVEGLSDIHEAGFVQGDFTLSNIVIDDNDNAKIIDINRRGCPVGWEPPEATPLIENNNRLSMYIGVKSDLYQLGMVLWALATQDDEPESNGRPLVLGADVHVPLWYRNIVDICLSTNPRNRMQALQLLSIFPASELDSPRRHDKLFEERDLHEISVDDGVMIQNYRVTNQPVIQTVHPRDNWAYAGQGSGYESEPATPASDEPYYYPPRGRSPPSPQLNRHGEWHTPKYGQSVSSWPGAGRVPSTAPSMSDAAVDDPVEGARSVTPRLSKDSSLRAHDLVEKGVATLGSPRQELGIETASLGKTEPGDPAESTAKTSTQFKAAELEPDHGHGGLTGSAPQLVDDTQEAIADPAVDVSEPALSNPSSARYSKLEEPLRSKSIHTLQDVEARPNIGDGPGDTNTTLTAYDQQTLDHKDETRDATRKVDDAAAAAPSLAKSEIPTPRGPGNMDDALAGIGSVCDLASDQRQSAITDDDFGLQKTTTGTVLM